MISTVDREQKTVTQFDVHIISTSEYFEQAFSTRFRHLFDIKNVAELDRRYKFDIIKCRAGYFDMSATLVRH